MRKSAALFIIIFLIIPKVALSWIYPGPKSAPDVNGSWEEKKRAYISLVPSYIEYYNQEFIKLNKLPFTFNAITEYDTKRMIKMNEKMQAEYFNRPSSELLKNAHDVLNQFAEYRLSQSGRMFVVEAYNDLRKIENVFSDYESVMSKVEVLQKAELRLAENEKSMKLDFSILIIAILAFIVYGKQRIKNLT